MIKKIEVHYPDQMVQAFSLGPTPWEAKLIEEFSDAIVVNLNNKKTVKLSLRTALFWYITFDN